MNLSSQHYPHNLRFLVSGAGSIVYFVSGWRALATSEGESIEATLSARGVIFRGTGSKCKDGSKWGSTAEEVA